MSERDWRIELPGYGVLEARHDGSGLCFTGERGGERVLGAHPLLEGEGSLVWAIGPSRRTALFGYTRDDRLHHFDVGSVSLTPVPLVERLRRVEELSIVVTDALYLAITENGIVAIEDGGRERWRIAETTYGWRFVGAQDDTLWLTDADGNLIGIDPADGDEV